MTFYKGNFFNATTLSTGASVASNQTMYGHEDLTMLLGGIGNKIGCNFEFKEGKIILQPSMLMSYTFVNTFDYTNAAGVRIKSDPLHSIQLSPGVKLIGNTKNGWQPYASVNMVWNLLDKSKVTAEDVRLPEISVKPYIQYGVGVQKKFKDNCMAFGQAMIQNGGRNGISLNAGLRWALGKEGAPIKVDNGKSLRSAQNDNKTLKQVQGDKTNTLTQRAGVREPQPSISPKLNIMSQQDILARSNGNTNTVGTKKIVKQLTPTQKTALGAKPQNTTRTTAYAVIKPL